MKELMTIGGIILLVAATSTSFARGTDESKLPLFYEDFDTITEDVALERAEIAAMENSPVKSVESKYYKGQRVDLLEHGFYEDWDTLTYDLEN